MPALVDISLSFPKNYYEQKDLIKELQENWKGKLTNLNRVETIHENVLVKGRHLAMPIKEYFKPKSFTERNQCFIETSVDLATDAISQLLTKYNLKPQDISSLWSNTVTGFAIPSLEARVMNRLPFSGDTKRVPILGLGCMAGAAGINRVSDYLKAYPHEAVLFFSVELCSLTLQLEDVSVPNLISTGLFGDGAACVLMVGDEHPLYHNAPLKWLGSKSVFFPDSETVMGWDVGEHGLKIILSKSVPRVTEEELPQPLESFLSSHGLKLNQIDSFFAHPGGPKVLTAMEKVLDLPNFGLKHSWDSLAENGNMSSVSVLDILKRHIDHKTPELKDRLALSMAMGPAFSAEMGLFKWN